MTMLSVPIALSSAIGVFAPVFARPVWQHGTVLLTGAVLAPGTRIVTAILRMMGRRAASDFQTDHRVLQRAVWSPLTASRLLLRLCETTPIDYEDVAAEATGCPSRSLRIASCSSP